MNRVKIVVKRLLGVLTAAKESLARLRFVGTKNIALRRIGRRLQVVTLHSGTFNAYSDRNNVLGILVATMDEMGIDYFVVPKNHGKYAVAVDSSHKDKLLDALGTNRQLKGYYVKFERSHHNVGVPVLLRPGMLCDRKSILAIELYRYIAGSSGSKVISTEPNAVGLEFWYTIATVPPRMKQRAMAASGIIDDRALEGALIAPVYNHLSQVFGADLQDKATLQVDGRTYPTLAVFTQKTQRDVPFPIDLVYTWVDGADEVWREKFAKYKRADYPNFLNNTASRYASHDELKYSLRSIDMYAPWARHVYIVTDGQRPDWLQDNDRLTVVDHKDIFAPDSLPVFNSHAIENRLHHINGLAEHYLYLNDDMMFVRSSQPDDFFFPNGIAKVPLSMATIGLGESTVYETAPSSAGKNARRIISEQLDVFITSKARHAPHVQKKSVALAIEANNKALVAATARSKFRSPSDIPFTSVLMQNYLVASGQGVPFDSATATVDISDRGASQRLHEFMAGSQAMTLCLNESVTPEGREEAVHRMVKDFLENLFPFPSQWERDDKTDKEE